MPTQIQTGEIPVEDREIFDVLLAKLAAHVIVIPTIVLP